MRILKGNSVSEVFIKVSAVCWAKKPIKVAKAAQNKKVVPFILKKFFKSSKLSGSSIYSVANIATPEEKNRHYDDKSSF